MHDDVRRRGGRGWLAGGPMAALLGSMLLLNGLSGGQTDESSGSLARAYLVLREPLDITTVEVPSGTDPWTRRQTIVAALKAHAAARQAGVRALLEAAARAGRARRIEILWAGNGIVFEATAEVLAALARRPEVDRVRLAAHTAPLALTDAPRVPPPPHRTALVEPHLIALEADRLWAAGFRGDGVVVGIIDTGVDASHPDLAQRQWTNPLEIPGNGSDDDGNGLIDDVVGWDFADGDNDPGTTASHGTLMAGLIVGDGTAGTSTGMAPGARMMVLRIGDEPSFWLAQQYCIEAGADVVSTSISFKWAFVPRPDYHMHRLLCAAELAAGLLHACSTGNEGDLAGAGYPVPFNVSVPGNCPSPWRHPAAEPGGRTSAMACAALHLADDSLYTGSGQGPSTWEDLTLHDPTYPHGQDASFWDYPVGGPGGVLPGLLKPDITTYTEVMSTLPGGTYSLATGTSAATALLAGGMLLLREVQPGALPRHLDAAIQLSARDLAPPGKDIRTGAGKLQVFAAARRLVTLGRFDPPEPRQGDALTLEIFGEPSALVFSFLAFQIAAGGGAFHLLPPFIPVGPFVLNASGRRSVSFQVPFDQDLVGLELYFQFAAPVAVPGAFGPGAFFSVPERLTVQP